jgi:YD repeat-containing protein
LTSLSFDGTVADFSSILSPLFALGNTYWKNDATSAEGLDNHGVIVAVPGWIGEGTRYTYGGNGAPAGKVSSTQSVTAAIEADGNVADLNTFATLTTDGYYGIGNYQSSNGAYVPNPGASYGQVEYSFDAAGQETFYGYDQSGRTILQYVYKQWTDSSGSLVDGWVGTTSVYDSAGRLTDTYSATYLDPAATSGSIANRTEFLPVTTGGPAGIQVDTNSADSSYVTLYADSLLRTQHIDYNSIGQKADTIDQYGGVTTYTYDANGNVIKTLYPNGTEMLSVFDALNRAIWTTNQFNPADTSPIITHTVYNQLGQVIETDTFEGGSIVIGTQSLGSATMPQSNIATTTVDGMLVPTGATFISSTKTFFDAAGNAIETIAASGLRTGTIYYPNGQVQYTGILSSSAPDDGHTAYPNGVETQAFTTADFATITVNGVTENTYTQSIQSQYDSSLGLFYTESIDQLGHVTKTYTDAEGRTVRVVNDDGSFTETLYNLGNTAVSYDQEGDAIDSPQSLSGGSETVDIAQRKIGDDPVATFDYSDAAGNLTDVWLPAVINGLTTSTTLVQTHWQYTYDTAGNELTQVSGNGNAYGATAADFTTTWAYDQNDNKVSQILPDGEKQTWTFDIYGNNISHKTYNASNHSTALQTTLDVYDTTVANGGRLLEENRYSSDQSVGSTLTPDERTTYTYDDNTSLPTAEQTDQGNVAQVDDYVLQGETLIETDFTHYTYDYLSGNQASITTADGTIHYIYDEATGNLIETWTGANSSAPQSSAQNDVKYGYDNQGRLESVTQVLLNGSIPPAVAGGTRFDADGNAIATTQPTTVYTYDAAGNLISDAEPNGDTTAYTYNNLDQVTDEIITNNNTGHPVFQEQTAWLNDGQKQDVVDTRYNADGSIFSQITYTWAYDADNRIENETLTVQSGSGTSVPTPYSDAYDYDLDNNRMHEFVNGGVFQSNGSNIIYNYNGDDQLITEIGSGAIGGYETDSTYDANGNLISQTRTGADAESDTYGYDLQNRMISADVGGTNTMSRSAEN